MRGSLLVVFCLLVLLVAACRPPEGKTSAQRATEASPLEGDENDPDDPGTKLGVGELGKQDYAKIRGELDCVNAHFQGDKAAKDNAIAGIYTRYGTTADWVMGVDGLMADSPYNKRISDAVQERKDEVCPGGTLQPDFLALLAP